MPTNIEGLTLYTLAEVASLLEVTLQTVRNEISRGKLRAHKFGLGVAITEGDFKAYLEESLKAAPQRGLISQPSENIHSEGRKESKRVKEVA